MAVEKSGVLPTNHSEVTMARNNFQYEKRQRELEKKRKAEEKARRKLDARNAPPAADGAEAVDAAEAEATAEQAEPGAADPQREAGTAARPSIA
ncbi:hypothetical protein [Massilia sp. YIM B02443]|uniref:hypothetical protein n=1 Tax=Massilia sp. YIM B02443 TaxID=3050127 RepID=UPI00280427B7|nr:hypothetical protein [Massilia sp. YIM B02443]